MTSVEKRMMLVTDSLMSQCVSLDLFPLTVHLRERRFLVNSHQV